MGKWQIFSLYKFHHSEAISQTDCDLSESLKAAFTPPKTLPGGIFVISKQNKFHSQKRSGPPYLVVIQLEDRQIDTSADSANDVANDGNLDHRVANPMVHFFRNDTYLFSSSRVKYIEHWPK